MTLEEDKRQNNHLHGIKVENLGDCRAPTLVPNVVWDLASARNDMPRSI